METVIDTRHESDHFMPASASEWQKKHPYEPSPKSHPEPIPLVSPADLVNPMLTVGDVAQKGVHACDPKLPLAEAIEMLAEAESGMLPVVVRGKPVGLLTEREVVRAVARSPSGFMRQMVESVMSHKASVVREDARLEELFDSFGNRGALVVNRSGKLVGVVYWRNLAATLSERGLGRLLSRLLERTHDKSIRAAEMNKR